MKQGDVVDYFSYQYWENVDNFLEICVFEPETLDRTVLHFPPLEKLLVLNTTSKFALVLTPDFKKLWVLKEFCQLNT